MNPSPTFVEMSYLKTEPSVVAEYDNPEIKQYPPEDTFTLAHISDPHLFSSENPKFRTLFNKRMYGYLSWRLHRHAEHRNDILHSLIRDMHAVRPDHIAVTGDLTHLSLPGEYVAARDFLLSLGSPSQVTVIPGNHDIYVPMRWENSFRLWYDYMISDDYQASEGRGENLDRIFPSLRVRGNIALISVSTAIQTLPFISTGNIGKPQMKKLAGILDETGRRGLVRIVLIHHPPVGDVVSWHKRLTDRKNFQDVIMNHGAELILHGHAHKVSLAHMTTPRGRIFSIGVPSASSIGRKFVRRARYNLCRISQNSHRAELCLKTKIYSPEEKGFIDETEQSFMLPGY